MIRLQAITADKSGIRQRVRGAIRDGSIRSFLVSQVKGGLRIKHKKFPGTITVSEKDGVFAATIACNNQSKEWQIFEAFVGRLAYHFSDDLISLNIQFSAEGE